MLKTNKLYFYIQWSMVQKEDELQTFLDKQKLRDFTASTIRKETGILYQAVRNDNSSTGRMIKHEISKWG